MKNSLKRLIPAGALILACTLIFLLNNPWFNETVFGKILVECGITRDTRYQYWIRTDINIAEGLIVRHQYGNMVLIDRYGPGECVRVD